MGAHLQPHRVIVLQGSRYAARIELQEAWQRSGLHTLTAQHLRPRAVARLDEEAWYLLTAVHSLRLCLGADDDLIAIPHLAALQYLARDARHVPCGIHQSLALVLALVVHARHGRAVCKNHDLVT